MSRTTPTRRSFLLAASTGVAGFALTHLTARAAKARKTLPRLPVEQVATDVLDIGYHAAGPEEGRPVVLLHDLEYDIHSYAEVAGILAAQGHRVIVPYLRGHGSTRFVDAATPRSAQRAALGSDAIAVIDALHIPEAVFAGFGWGAHAAFAAAALKPTRCVGIVAVRGYPLQNYFQTERARASLETDRRAIARHLWQSSSPAWRFDEAVFERAAQSLDNPDHVDIVTHAYRHRFGGAPGDPQYDAAEKKIAATPAIMVPAITLEGTASGVPPAPDSAARLSGTHSHRRIDGAGHNVPQEAPQAFADAVAELVRNGKWRT